MLGRLGRFFGRGTIQPDFWIDGPPGVPRVLIFTEHVNATYYISFDLPLRALNANGKVAFAVVAQQRLSQDGTESWAAWGRTFRPDVVILSRVGHASGPAIMEAFQSTGTPVIYHIDDDLLELPEALGKEIVGRQGAADVVAVRRTMLERCDLIYASTETLAETLKARFPYQQIYFGIYAQYMGGEGIPSSAPASNDGLVIGYMGSKGHQRDIELVVPALIRLLNERPSLRVEFFGTIRIPEPMLQFGRRVGGLEVTTSYRDFLARLASLKWDIGLAPLVDSPFNRCKAPTKFIEYASCSIPVVASKVSVYEQAIPKGCGVLVEDDWHGALASFLDSRDAREAAVQAAAKHCLVKYAPEELQRQVLSVIQKAKETRVPR